MSVRERLLGGGSMLPVIPSSSSVFSVSKGESILCLRVRCGCDSEGWEREGCVLEGCGRLELARGSGLSSGVSVSVSMDSTRDADAPVWTYLKGRPLFFPFLVNLFICFSCFSSSSRASRLVPSSSSNVSRTLGETQLRISFFWTILRTTGLSFG